MKFIISLLLFVALAGCDRNGDEAFKKAYIAKFVESCSKVGFKEVCTCQATRVVNDLPHDQLKDKDKVRDHVFEVTADCLQEHLAKINPNLKVPGASKPN